MILPAMLHPQTHWTNYQNNPVIDEDFDAGSVVTHRPSVIFNGSIYHMWYTNARVKKIGVVELNLNYMGYATSPDGIQWTLVNPTVIAPTDDQNDFDQFHAGQGWVISDNDTLKMWYWGFNIYTGKNVIGYAWSTDGVSWNRVRGPGHLGSVYDLDMAGLSDSYGLATPCVVKHDGMYHMWHSQILIASSAYRIGYARSTDGTHWTKVPGDGMDGAVIDMGPSGRFDEYAAAWPAAMTNGNTFMMWYYGNSASGGRQGYSVSTDGVRWELVSAGGSNGACFDDAHAVSVIRIGEEYRMWYAVFEDFDIINYATSELETAVDDGKIQFRPPGYCLNQNYPNPFNNETIITFNLVKKDFVRLAMFDVRGRAVAVLINGIMDQGEHSVSFNTKNMSSGIYFVTLEVDRYTQVRKMSLLK